jgi:hypothetical protein
MRVSASDTTFETAACDALRARGGITEASRRGHRPLHAMTVLGGRASIEAVTLAQALSASEARVIPPRSEISSKIRSWRSLLYRSRRTRGDVRAAELSARVTVVSTPRRLCP